MTSAQTKVSGAPLPTQWEGGVFAVKAFLLRRRRAFKNAFTALPRAQPHADFADGILLGQSVSLLRFDEQTALALVDGKIHNIRNAIKKLDGIVVRKDDIFSFWRQVGKLTRLRGYALGRELREGCIIPQIGGGICQLSNAIYDAALNAGLEIVERHGHSQVIKGSLAELGRDATVFWNYLDLRLKGAQDWQLRVTMGNNRLIAGIYGKEKKADRNKLQILCAPAALGDCTQCGRTDCYLHTGDIPGSRHKTWLAIDEDWVEFAQWRKNNFMPEDRLLSTTDHPSLDTRALNFCSKLSRRYHLWLGERELHETAKLSMKDGQPVYNWRKHPIPLAHNARFRLIARHFAKKLKASDTRLVIPQPLLVWLYLAGELAGRDYDVLMSALPMSEIESKLDAAMERYGFRIHDGYYDAVNSLGKNGVTLGDYRAPRDLIAAEQKALSGASRLVSPHTEILKWAGAKAVPLEWIAPAPVASVSSMDSSFKILLAGVALGRKGVFDLRAALQRLNFGFELLLIPSAVESDDFWRGIHVRRVNAVDEGISLCDVVVLPAVVEHNPRGLLLALASKKPTIASSACGLPESLKWKRADDAEELERLLSICFHAVSHSKNDKKTLAATGMTT